MGLDSTVKTHLRGIAKSVFSYSSSLKDVWTKHEFGAVVIDMNVELFRKPHTCHTGRQWAEYIYRARIKGARPAQVVVLLFDSASRVPAVKDLCHLDRNTKKRKRGGFVPLPKTTTITDGQLPDWGRVTGSKHILPAVWNYLIGALKGLLSDDIHNTKTVYFDTPFNPLMSVKCPNLNGKIHLGWKGDLDRDERPCHMYGEGDLKTLSWCKCLLEKWHIKKILVLSTDLDNIAIFCRPQFKGVHMMGNTVYIDKNNTVVPRCTKPKKAPQAKSAYEVIHIGGLPDALGPTWDAFVNVLTLSKNDFQESVHRLTTDRMIKAYLYLKKTRMPVDASRLISDREYYMRFLSCCCGKKANKRACTPPIVGKSEVEAYLARARWVREYWDGVDEAAGGPDCKKSAGWRRPKNEGEDAGLEEYGGKVRLVRA